MLDEPEREHQPHHPHTADCPDPHGLVYAGDIQALRRADTVTVRAQDGLGSIQATLTAPDGLRIYTAPQQRAFPDAAGYQRHLPGAAAAAVIDNAALNDVWQSITGFLHVGDVLRLRFRADSTHDPVSGYALHRDELHLLIHRGHRRWTFLLEVTVRPAEDRMVILGH